MADVRISMHSVKKRAKATIQKIGEHHPNHDHHHHQHHTHEKIIQREKQLGDGSKEITRRKTIVHHSTSNSWCGGWYMFLWIAVFFFFFFVMISAASWRSHGQTGYYNHHYAVKDVIRRVGACSVGETYYSQFQQCLPTLMSPVGIDSSIQDHTAAACEDFEKFSCGKWNDDPNHSGESRSFTYIQRKNQYQVQKIVEDPSVKGVHEFYKSCIDTLVYRKHDTLTKQERDHELELILGSFKSLSDLPDVFGRLLRNSFTAPFILQIETHPLEPVLIPLISFDEFPLDLSDEVIIDLFMENTKTRLGARGKMGRLREVLTFLEESRPKDIDNYVAYSTGQDFQADLLTWKDFTANSFVGGQFDWDRLLQRLDGHQFRFNPDQKVWVRAKHHFANTNFKLLNYDQWKSYIEFSILYHTESFFPDLPSNVFYKVVHPLRKEYRYTKMERLHRKKSMVPDAPVSKQDCVRATQFLLPGLVSEEFLKRGFHDEVAANRVKQVVEDVRNELALMQQETPYIDNKTRAAIVKKTRAIKVRVAHPTRFKVEPFVDSLTTDRYLRNLDMIREYRVQRDLELWKAGGELDRDEAARFQGPLSTVNAWYSPQFNVITIYPGIMRYPFFNRNFNNASVFAGIGMVASHELGHNGDSNGVLFDENGSLKNLWSAESQKHLLSHFKCIEDEYNTPPGNCKRENYGKQVLGEAAADRTGIEVAFRAWKQKAKGGHITKLEARDFFISYAQTWCSSYTPEETCDRVENDVHPLAKQRVLKTLRNFPSFAWAYNCKSGMKMVNEPACKLYGK